MGSCLGHCCVLRRDFRCRTFFSFLRAKHKRDTSLHIELLDDAWSLDDAEYVNSASNEAMINLVSHTQKVDENQRAGTPTSLELEWENLPGLELSTYATDQEEKDNRVTTNSISTCSHATSHDSLEWDPVIGGMTDLMNAETEQLLQEVEMLNSKVLQETEKWSS